MRLLRYFRKKWHNDLVTKQEIEHMSNTDVLSAKEDILAALSWNNLELIRFRDGMIRTTPRKTIKLCFDIIEKCNLNCVGCLVYSPLADENSFVMDICDFERDIKRLSELFLEEEIDVITLSGGEPLLHQKLIEFPPIIRKVFPNVAVRIVTNGLLLLKQEDAFWECCRTNNVTLEQTKYPIDLDYKKIGTLAKEKGVQHVFMDDTGEVTKTMQIFPVDMTAMSEKALNSQNERLNFFNCWEANQCIRVQNGRIYTCSRIPHIKLLNKYFNLNYHVTDDDSMDIYTAKDKKEIYNFLATATPFCRYCKVNSISEGHAWSVSKKQIEEWGM